MTQIRIPPECRECVASYGIKTWAKDKDFPRDEYFDLIDSYGESLRKITAQDEIENKFFIPALMSMIEAQESLLDFILNNESEVGNAEKWYAVNTAAAWVILQMYRLAVEKGEWPNGE